MTTKTKSSPRPWGCFRRPARRATRRIVFPTPVGVFLADAIESAGIERLPHARGGVSDPLVSTVTTSRSSPRPWGCFCGIFMLALMVSVFPTPVGVFPQSQ